MEREAEEERKHHLENFINGIERFFEFIEGL
jgi:hypothetical protein